MDVRRSILLAVLLAGVCAVLTGALWQLRSEPAKPVLPLLPPSPSMDAPSEVSQSLEILRSWDLNRADAWARGDVAALRALYAPGSRTGAADSAMLRSYVERGLVVEGMNTQVLAADVRSFGPDRIVVVLTDRLAAATAIGVGVRTVLPRDRPSRHTLELVRVSGSWLVEEVR